MFHSSSSETWGTNISELWHSTTMIVLWSAGYVASKTETKLHQIHYHGILSLTILTVLECTACHALSQIWHRCSYSQQQKARKGIKKFGMNVWRRVSNRSLAGFDPQGRCIDIRWSTYAVNRIAWDTGSTLSINLYGWMLYQETSCMQNKSHR